MRELRKNEVIKFSMMDDFTGNEMELIGTIIGDHEEVRRRFPEECGEAEDGVYLVEVAQRSGLFVVTRDDVLEVLGEKEEQ